MERIGTGRGIAALLNGRAKQVNAKVVRALERALPDALILVSEDFAQARRHVRNIVAQKPLAILSGGGDGAQVKLLNLLREESRGEPFPPVGVMKLGTGNGWARTSGASDFFTMVKELPLLPRALPTMRFDLVEVEDQLCHFAGVGWDAKLLNDYLRNLDKRSSQLVGSSLAKKIHKGIPGYLYSLFRLTVPDEWTALRKYGQATVVLENRGPEAFGLDAAGELFRMEEKILHTGPVSVGAASSTPEWGFNFRAFPFARIKPGFINVRVYDRPVLEAVMNMATLWKGVKRLRGMHDFFATHVAMRFSRPMPFQIGGDGVGMREEIVYRTAKETVPVIDWKAAMDLVREREG